MNRNEIINWLLKGDVSIQYQTNRDLLNVDPQYLDDLRQKIATQGWGYAFLVRQREDGHWGKSFYQPKWTSTHYTLLDLKNLGVPCTPGITKALNLIIDTCKDEDGSIISVTIHYLHLIFCFIMVVTTSIIKESKIVGDKDMLEIVTIKEHPELIETASSWFHRQWGIPKEAYYMSMKESFDNDVPSWYVVVEGEHIVAGCGVIANDFHHRVDLSPNVCAIYVEPTHRQQGICGLLLKNVIHDFHLKGIDTLYLLTDHTSFYERYGWQFLEMVQGDGEVTLSRMYRYSHKDDVQ